MALSSNPRRVPKLWDPIGRFCYGDTMYAGKPYQCVHYLKNGKRCQNVISETRIEDAIYNIESISKRPLTRVRDHEIIMVLSNVLCYEVHAYRPHWEDEMARCRAAVRRAVRIQQEDAQQKKDLGNYYGFKLKATKQEMAKEMFDEWNKYNRVDLPTSVEQELCPADPEADPEITQDEHDNIVAEDMISRRARHDRVLRKAQAGIAPCESAWETYQKRWANITRELKKQHRPTAGSKVSQNGYELLGPWFATMQPAFIHERLPWPVDSMDPHDVTRESVSEFYRKNIMATRYTIPEEGKADVISAADMVHYGQIVAMEESRWWPLIVHIGGVGGEKARAGLAQRALEGYSPARILLDVLRVLDEMRNETMGRLLAEDAEDGKPFVMPTFLRSTCELM